MSLLDIEFVNPVNPQYIAIKAEDIKDDASAAEEYNSSGEARCSYLIGAARTKCGEIFTVNNSEFTLICEFCHDSYDTLNEFGEHLQQKHSFREEKEDIVEYKDPEECYDDSVSVHEFLDVDDRSGDAVSEVYILDPAEDLLKSPSLSCKDCNKQYRSQELLEKHTCLAEYKSEITEASPDIKPTVEDIKPQTETSELCCKMCHKQYRTRTSFARHKCRVKSEDSSQQSKAQNAPEESASTDSNEKKPVVTQDPQTSTEQRECKSEKITNPDLYCEICDRQFKYKNIFKKHGMQHSVPPIALQKDPEYLKCRYCGIKATNNDEWFRHENSHTEVTPYQCTYCPKRFKSRMEVDMHTNSHTGNRPFKCDQCGVAFAHSNNLSTHVKRVHLKLTPFACSVCNKKFLRNVELRIHMRQHTGERPYQCEECGRSFMIAVQLNEHRKKHTNVRDVQCPACPMAFFTKKMLRKHMVKHSDERPHVCSICGRTFSRKKALIVHNKIHQDFKEYVCAICGKAFAQPAGLYSHKKSHINSVDST